jgi:hypothetical protein
MYCVYVYTHTHTYTCYFTVSTSDTILNYVTFCLPILSKLKFCASDIVFYATITLAVDGRCYMFQSYERL